MILLKASELNHTVQVIDWLPCNLITVEVKVYFLEILFGVRHYTELMNINYKDSTIYRKQRKT